MNKRIDFAHIPIFRLEVLYLVWKSSWLTSPPEDFIQYFKFVKIHWREPSIKIFIAYILIRRTLFSTLVRQKSTDFNREGKYSCLTSLPRKIFSVLQRAKNPQTSLELENLHVLHSNRSVSIQYFNVLKIDWLHPSMKISLFTFPPEDFIQYSNALKTHWREPSMKIFMTYISSRRYLFST